MSPTGAFAAGLLRRLWPDSSARGFGRLRARLTRADSWPMLDDNDDSLSLRGEREGVTGLLAGVRIWAGRFRGGAVARVSLMRWPAELAAAARRTGDGVGTTGDPEFDRRVALAGPEAAWRPILTGAVRRVLVRLVVERGAAIAPGTAAIECVLDQSDRDEIEAVVEEMIALAGALPDVGEPHPGVLHAAQREPLALVRAGQYEWLVAERWSLPLVLRSAAGDGDPAIAAWARSQLPPDQGIYR